MVGAMGRARAVKAPLRSRFARHHFNAWYSWPPASPSVPPTSVGVALRAFPKEGSTTATLAHSSSSFAHSCLDTRPLKENVQPTCAGCSGAVCMPRKEQSVGTPISDHASTGLSCRLPFESPCRASRNRREKRWTCSAVLSRSLGATRSRKHSEAVSLQHQRRTARSSRPASLWKRTGLMACVSRSISASLPAAYALHSPVLDVDSRGASQKAVGRVGGRLA